MARRYKKNTRKTRFRKKSRGRKKKSSAGRSKASATKKAVARISRAVKSIQREIRPVHRNIEHRPSALQLQTPENEVTFYQFLIGQKTDHDACKANIFNAAGGAVAWEKGSWYTAKQYMKSIFRNNYLTPVELDIWKFKFQTPSGVSDTYQLHDPINALLKGGTEHFLGGSLSYLAGPPVTLDTPIMQYGPGMAQPTFRNLGWKITKHYNVFLNPQEEVSVTEQTKWFHRFQETHQDAMNVYQNWTRGYLVRVRGRPAHGAVSSATQGWMDAKVDCQHLIKNYVRGRGSVGGMVTKHEWIDPTFGTGLEIMLSDDPAVEAAPE